MSRSKKKTSIQSVSTCRSARPYKEQRTGQERTWERLLLQLAFLGDLDAAFLLEDEIMPWDEWASDRDGKHYFDPKKWPEAMRK